MIKTYEYSKESLKFKEEYYKNPLTIEDCSKNFFYSRAGFAFLGYDGTQPQIKIPDYLVDYVINFPYYDEIMYRKYSNLIINWLYGIDSNDSSPSKNALNYIPVFKNGTLDLNVPKISKIAQNICLFNNYKYEKLYSTIILKYGILDNLDITREETVTETYGAQKNELTEVHGTQTQSTTNSIGSNTVKTDYGKQSSTATTQPVTTTTTNPATHSTTINKSTTYDSETAYLKDSTEVTTDTNTVQVSTGLQTDNAINDAYSDTVTNGAREDSSNVSRETYTDTTTDTKDGYTNTVTRKSREYGDASVRTVADNIKQEREIAYINLLDIIYKDVLDVLCDYYVQ